MSIQARKTPRFISRVYEKTVHRYEEVDVGQQVRQKFVKLILNAW